MNQGSFVSTQLNGFKYRKWLNGSIWLIDWILTGTIALGQSGCGSGVMVVNGYSTFPKAPGLEPYYHIV